MLYVHVAEAHSRQPPKHVQQAARGDSNLAETMHEDKESRGLAVVSVG